MKCPTEFTCALWADGELDPREAEVLVVHLDSCPRCRALVRSLESESRLLAHSLQEIAEPGPQPATEPGRLSSLGRLAAAVVGGALLLRLGSFWIPGFGLPLGFDWLHPLRIAGGVNWLASTVFYVVNDGGSMVASYTSEWSLIVFNSVLFAGILFTAYRLRPARIVVGLGMLVAVMALPGYSIDVRSPGPGGPAAHAVGPDEVVDDTLVVFGESISVAGTITGDLIAFVQRVDIEGTVEGNIVVFAQNVDVSGTVGGDLFVVSQTLRVAGRIGQNLWRLGQSVDLEDSGLVDGNAIVLGAQAIVGGGVGRDLMVYGATLDVDGRVGGNLDFRGVRVTLRAPATVGGRFLARVQEEENVDIEAGASIAGERTVELVEPEPSQYIRPGYYVGQVIRLAGAFVTALLLFWLVPGLRRVDLNSARALLVSGGIGFLAVVAVPVAALIVALTLVGLPVAVLAVGLWIVGLYLSKIMVAQFLGRALLDGGSKTSPALALLVGLLVVLIAVNLPFVGGIINFLLVLIGFGVLLTTAYDLYVAGAASPAAIS